MINDSSASCVISLFYWAGKVSYVFFIMCVFTISVKVLSDRIWPDFKSLKVSLARLTAEFIYLVGCRIFGRAHD